MNGVQIYSPHILAGRRIPANEVISILDADHKVASEFFKALTPLFDRGDDVAMVRKLPLMLPVSGQDQPSPLIHGASTGFHTTCGSYVVVVREMNGAALHMMAEFSCVGLFAAFVVQRGRIS